MHAGPAYNPGMRMRDLMFLVLATGPIASCALTERHPFHTIANSTPASTLPPGVRMALYLDGVLDAPVDSIPVRSYELKIELEQDPFVPQWRPSFDDATLRDDEGNVFRLNAWYVDDSKSKPAGLQRYRCVFELQAPYRFQSIMGVSVRWKLVSRQSPVFRITSRFKQ